MTQEEKQLLLKTLCAILPYGVKFALSGNSIYTNTVDGIDLIVTDEGDWEYAVTAKGIEPVEIKYIKLYLRPMSSMTEEEYQEFGYDVMRYTPREFDWLNEHHFDYRGLIEKGLALEAPDGMYKTE